MSITKYLFPRTSTKRKILDIKDDIEKSVRPVCSEKFHLTWYGAYDINPKHLVYWVCIQTDKVKKELAENEQLNKELRQLLEKYQYPTEAQNFVHIGFESQETVDRESKGNWYHHFK